MFQPQKSWRAYRQNQSDSFKPLAFRPSSGVSEFDVLCDEP
jgi:hypothetical protein